MPSTLRMRNNDTICTKCGRTHLDSANPLTGRRTRYCHSFAEGDKNCAYNWVEMDPRMSLKPHNTYQVNYDPVTNLVESLQCWSCGTITEIHSHHQSLKPMTSVLHHDGRITWKRDDSPEAPLAFEYQLACYCHRFPEPFFGF